MIKLEMKNFIMTIIEKLQNYQPFSSRKTDKYEYLTGEEILFSN